MTETPVVIVDAQRGGPSTGLPTRTEQSDLQFVLHASHGEFPRLVLAPGTIEQCFEAGHRAFNLAEKYQTPVIILTDLHLAFSVRTVDKEALDLGNVRIERGELIPWDRVNGEAVDYQRHRPTESGISQRILPGGEEAVYITTGDEHTPYGFITEDAEVRDEQMEKRMRKLDGAKRDVEQPTWYGPSEADVTLVGWGSSIGALREAMELLNAEGVRTNLLQFVDIFPLDEDLVTAELGRIRMMVVAEQNYTGQLANVLRMYSGRKADVLLTKYDGRPFSARWVVERVKSRVGVALHA
jgi:2-oxoglutarate ferredoxin oxidoreductase subunit alpha